ncbi:MAG: class I SAM-dependent methyltransferase [Flammeovirgaceae bacterium]|nr:class I SAM-dependent methyltransferase [Flammeovirgaceae bacterium]
MTKDRFSGHADKYAVFRPTYPQQLYQHILSKTSGRKTAWDCGTGNGQVARDLANHFEKVEATDISQKQIDNAAIHPSITYSISAAEKTTFNDNSFDLITVAQALHWFSLNDFFKEVQRVGKKGATLAVWGYNLPRLDKEIDKVLDHFYTEFIGAYWDTERRLVETRYANLEFPFREKEYWTNQIITSWSYEDFIGYVNTWSAVQNYIKVHQSNPVDHHFEKIKPLFNENKIDVSFPLFLWTSKIK